MTDAAPEACGEFVRLWGEFAGTASDAGITVRRCIPDTVLATVYRCQLLARLHGDGQSVGEMEAGRWKIARFLLRRSDHILFRDSVRNGLIIDDTAMEHAETLTRRVLQLADNWPEIQRVVHAAMEGQYPRGRGGRGHAGGADHN